MYQKLTKNALKCMYIETFIAMAIWIGVLSEAEYALHQFFDIRFLDIPIILLCVVAALNAVVSPFFRFHRYKYKIDNEAIDIIEGYIFTKRNIVPIERLHKLEIQRGPIDRMTGVAKVIVTTAGGDVTIRFLDEERANMITEGLKKRINKIVTQQGEKHGSTEI